MHTDDLDQLLRSADPWPGDVPTALTREVTAQVIAADRGAAAKVRSRRPLAAVIAAALLVAVPTTATRATSSPPAPGCSARRA